MYAFVIIDLNKLTFCLDSYDLWKLPKDGYFGEVVDGNFRIVHAGLGMVFTVSKATRPDPYVYLMEME